MLNHDGVWICDDCGKPLRKDELPFINCYNKQVVDVCPNCNWLRNQKIKSQKRKGFALAVLIVIIVIIVRLLIGG
jgi:hypothetical protein